MLRTVTMALLMLAAAIGVQAQLTRSALFLGNSYTGFNNLPQLVHDLAASAGDSLVFASNTPGGYTMEAHTLNSVSTNLISTGSWDYVLLQGQSREPILNPGLFNQGASDLVSLTRQHNPCAVPLFYMTWGRENGDPLFCDDFPVVCTYQGMDSALRERYEHVASVHRAEVSPVSVVWRYVRNNHPGIQLYNVDGSHPSAAGTYAAACCFYAAIFKHDPTLITDDFGLNATTAAAIRQAAKTVVFDDLEAWNHKVLPQSTFHYAIGAGINEVIFSPQSFGALQSYAWGFGDGNTSSLSYPTHSYGANGTYTVSLTTTNCDVEGTHTSTTDTVIQFCDHTPTIAPANPWLCNYDTLWTQSADAHQWYTGNVTIPETDSFLANYQQYNHNNFSVRSTQNGCTELSQAFTDSPGWTGYYFDAAWGGDPCEGDTALFVILHQSGALPASAIVQWYQNGNLMPQQTNEDTLRITKEGSYYSIVVDPASNCPQDTTISSLIEFDCGSDTIPDTLIGVGIDQAHPLAEAKEELLLYPNPTSGILNVKVSGPSSYKRIEIYNASGTLLRLVEMKGEATIDVTAWASGLYYLRQQNSLTSPKRFIKY